MRTRRSAAAPDDAAAPASIANSVKTVQHELGRSLDVKEDELKRLVREVDQLGDLLKVKVKSRERCITGTLERDLASIQHAIGQSDDVVVRRFNLGGKQNLRAAVVFIEGLVETHVLHENVLEPLMLLNRRILSFEQAIDAQTYLDLVRNHCLTIGSVREQTVTMDAIRGVLTGDTLLLVDGLPKGLVLDTKGWERRSIEEPATETVIRGPRDAFTETLRTNTALLRRRIKDPDLVIKTLQVGQRTRTDISVAYIASIANPHIVKETLHRLQMIETDAILESGYIEHFIEDDYISPFPQMQNTERPAKLAGHLLEGHVGILVDGTPFVLILPATFNQFYQSPDDYNERWLIGTLIRLIRVLALFSSLTFTSIYVALISFHPEMLPTRFAVAVAGGRSGIPFPSIIEAFVMEVTMEVLREASLRLPRPIGPTISIVGALVIGEAATRAGIVSPLMVIVVALTTIGSFAIPSFSQAIALRILKFPVILAAGTFGLYGVMVALIVITVHLCSLKSFGIPYLTPFTPFRPRDLKDTVLRFPQHFMQKRPQFLRTQDETRIPHVTSIMEGTHEKKRTRGDD